MTPENKTQTGVGADGVRVGQPEVERHDRRLHEKSACDKNEGDHDESIRGSASEGAAKLREIERAGAAVKQREPKFLSSSSHEHCAEIRDVRKRGSFMTETRR